MAMFFFYSFIFHSLALFAAPNLLTAVKMVEEGSLVVKEAGLAPQGCVSSDCQISKLERHKNKIQQQELKFQEIRESFFSEHDEFLKLTQLFDKGVKVENLIAIKERLLEQMYCSSPTDAKCLQLVPLYRREIDDLKRELNEIHKEKNFQKLLETIKF